MAPCFVSFHADRPTGSVGVHPNANLATNEYTRMLDLLFQSARLTHPRARCVLLTDAATAARGVQGPFDRWERTVDHGALMRSRAEAQLAFLEQDALDRPIALLDSDILVNGSLAPTFAEDFDVAVTWRPLRKMPINGGVLLLNNHRPERTRAFFRRFVHLYRTKYSGDGNAAWFGDQYALLHAVGASYDELAHQPWIERDDCRIRVLPCETHNFSPEPRLAAVAGGLPDKLVLHFKGQRKRLMQPFWDAFLQPRTVAWPLRKARARAALASFAALCANETPPPATAAGSDDD